MLGRSLHLLCCAGLVLGVASAQKAGSENTLELGYTLAYEDAVKRKDVRVAVSYLLTKALASDGVSVNFTYYDAYRDGLEAVLAGDVAASELPGHYFAALSNEDQEKLRGILVPQRHETATSEYLLLGAKGKTLEDAKGGSLRVVERRNRGLAPFWFETVLAERFEGARIESYFDDVIECEKPSDALLPTFFGKSDLCLISRGDFDLLTELNPQIAKRLTILERSEPLVPMVLVLRSDYDGIDIDKAVASAATLHSDADGQQALTLMQVCQFSVYEEENFKATRALVARAKELGIEPD